MVALGIELSAAALSGPLGQPALDYRVSRAPRSRTETLLLPKQACFHLHLCPIVQSERQDLNLRSPGPRPGAITRLRYVLITVVHVVSSPYGNRTHLAALKGRYPVPIDERAMLCALVERGVGREVLEPSSAVLQTAAIPSQLPAQVVVRARKNPVSLALVTPGSKRSRENSIESQAQTGGGGIRRLIGETTFPSSFGYLARS